MLDAGTPEIATLPEEASSIPESPPPEVEGWGPLWGGCWPPAEAMAAFSPATCHTCHIVFRHALPL